MALNEADLRQAILEELDRHTVMTLATCGAAGPHAVSLMYANECFDLYWLSDPKTRHSRQLEGNPSAAVTIAGQYEDFGEIRGLQMRGQAWRAEAEAKSGYDLLAGRYAFLKRFAIGELARHLGAAAVYMFRPSQLTLIDNSRGFGFKQVLELTDRPAEIMEGN